MKTEIETTASPEVRKIQDLIHGINVAEMWHPEAKRWFPLGVEDPELSLLRVNVHLAEYWDGPSHGKIVL